MTKMKLTQKVVDSLDPISDGVLWDDDTPGLGLRTQRGKRSWVVRYRVAGVQRQKSLPGGLKLAKARQRADAIRAAAVEGIDRVAEGRAKAEADRREERAEAEAERREAELAKARSLGAIAEKYLKDAERRLRPASFKAAKLYLNGPKHWGQLHSRPADELTRRDILGVLEEWSGRVTAAQMLFHLSGCLSWGVERSLFDRNCAAGIKAPVEKVARERVLSDAEIRQLWKATGRGTAEEVEAQYFSVLRLLLLTGQRRGEVGGMTRPEIDLERGLWSLTGARTKNGLPHEVPLSSQAKAIILPALEQEGSMSSRQRRRAETSEDADAPTHVFGTNGFRSWGRYKDKLDLALKIPEWTVHDLRRTVVTGMAEIGIAPHIVEAIVNHVSGHKGGVAGVYNRAKYSKEKRVALQRWADHVERLVSDALASNVVSMAR